MWHVAARGDGKQDFVGNPEGKRQLGTHRRRCNDNIEGDLK
jgi:hypothetical protein